MTIFLSDEIEGEFDETILNQLKKYMFVIANNVEFFTKTENKRQLQ